MVTMSVLVVKSNMYWILRGQTTLVWIDSSVSRVNMTIPSQYNVTAFIRSIVFQQMAPPTLSIIDPVEREAERARE